MNEVHQPLEQWWLLSKPWNHCTGESPLPFHACIVLQGLHHSTTDWFICRSQWFPLPPSGLPLLLNPLADRGPEDAPDIILWIFSCWSDYARLWYTAYHGQFQYPIFSLRRGSSTTMNWFWWAHVVCLCYGSNQMAKNGPSKHYHHWPTCKFSSERNPHVLAHFKESK